MASVDHLQALADRMANHIEHDHLPLDAGEIREIVKKLNAHMHRLEVITKSIECRVRVSTARMKEIIKRAGARRP
jgi:hypothetical protein